MPQKSVTAGTPGKLQRILPYILLVGSIVGLIASFALVYDKLQILHNPAYRPNCNLSPILSCESVMNAPQASIFGVPNPVFGLVLFGMLAMLALCLLAGARLQRWLWAIVQVMASLGLGFMAYLIFESAWRLHTICPWCFGVWMITIPIFWGVSVRNLREGVFGYPHRRLGKAAAGLIEEHPLDVLILMYLIVFGIIAIKFWYYWKTLL